MENWQLIYKIYTNYKKKEIYIFHFSDEVKEIGELISENILASESFHHFDEENTVKQLSSDPFTKKGWEYFLGI